MGQFPSHDSGGPLVRPPIPAAVDGPAGPRSLAGRRSSNILLQITLFLLPVLFSLYGLIMLVSAQLDAWEYPKLIAPRGPSLIVGTSRAAWGIRPEEFSFPILNFAFSVPASSYGELYFRAIEAKTRYQSGGCSVVEVMPLSLMLYPDETEDSLREAGDLLAKTHQFWGNPNLEYILRYNLPKLLERGRQDTVGALIGRALFEPEQQRHRNLRLMTQEDGWTLAQRIGADEVLRAQDEEHLSSERDLLLDGTISEYRMEWLARTLEHLRGKGEVMMVRLPTSTAMLAAEREVWADFDNQMEEIARTTGVSYVNLTHLSDDRKMLDPCHLKAEAATEISLLIDSMIGEANASSPASTRRKITS